MAEENKIPSLFGYFLVTWLVVLWAGQKGSCGPLSPIPADLAQTQLPGGDPELALDDPDLEG